jgi:hypothetical protein
MLQFSNGFHLVLCELLSSLLAEFSIEQILVDYANNVWILFPSKKDRCNLKACALNLVTMNQAAIEPSKAILFIIYTI